MIARAIVTEKNVTIEQTACGYERCPNTIEIVPGHRKREYCNSTCRKAAQRLRKQREQCGKKADVGSFLGKIHSPRLRAILERVLREQGEVALLSLVFAVDEECGYAQASDEMQQRVAHLEIKLSQYREIVDLDDRERICQQFIAAGQVVDYRALPRFHIREGIEAWRDYESWTHEATLAEVILYCRELADQEAAVKERSKLRQVERQLAAAQAELQKPTGDPQDQFLEEERAKYADLLADFMKASKKIANLERHVQRAARMEVLRSRESMLQDLMLLGGRLKYASLTDLGIKEGIDQWLEYARTASDKDLAMAIAHGYYQADSLAMATIEASDVMRRRIKELEAEAYILHRELDRYLPPPRELLECSLRRWSALVNLPYDDWKPDRIDILLRESSDRALLKLLEWAEPTYFIGKHRSRRIGIIQEHLSELESYRGSTIESMDDQGYATFVGGGRRFMDTDDIQDFWAEIVGKQGQQAVGSNPQVAAIQQYLCEHPGESIPIRQGKREYEIVFLDDDAVAITKKLRPMRLYDGGIEQAYQWIESKRGVKSVPRLERTVDLSREEACHEAQDCASYPVKPL
jgi:hypothetical protein